MNDLGTLVRLCHCSQHSVGSKTADQRHRVLHLNYVWLRNKVCSGGGTVKGRKVSACRYTLILHRKY